MNDALIVIFTVLAMFWLVFMMPLAIASDSEDRKYNQCIEAKMEWVDGNCLSTERSR